MDEPWLYHCDSETKQQSVEWRNSGSPHPKKFRVQKSAGNFSPRFFGIKTASSHSLSSKGSNYQRGVLLVSAGVTEEYFEGKKPREIHQRGLVLARQCPGSPGTCNPEETGLPGLPISWSPTLSSGSGPVGLSPVPWTENAIERPPIFVESGGHCCRWDLVGPTTFWIFFFEWLAKVTATG